MESPGFYLKQALAVLLSASLLSATAPPPSPSIAGASRVQLYKRIPALTARPALIRKIPAQSATLAIEQKVRSQLESDGISLVCRGKKAKGSIISVNQKAMTTGRANDVAAKRQLTGNKAALDAHGLSFIENEGQFDANIKFQVSNHEKSLWLMKNGVVFEFLRDKPSQANLPPSEVHPSNENTVNAAMINEVLAFSFGTLAQAQCPTSVCATQWEGAHDGHI